MTTGIFWIEIPEAELRIQCGCPADAVKHLMRRGLIADTEIAGVQFETGPNAILLSDVMVQNGEFANLGEFSVLQMLYRQGMILPDHPNNSGTKPLLIGNQEQLDAQLAYIHRGNYGLVSEEELIAAGCSQEEAAEQMRMKLWFAFGEIRPPDKLLETCVVEEGATPIRNGVTVRRMALNRVEFAFKGETLTIDLNLKPSESYEPPYSLGFHQVERGYFTVIHSGEGDGWDINRPCMGSLISYQGNLYLIDAGPNLR
ncbi:MAG: cyclic nucleotide-binding protein, partial [Rhodospirillales bacterium]|nr:cyclic nucleotide-binding protein [Rhodospirillales bacterium]